MRESSGRGAPDEYSEPQERTEEVVDNKGSEILQTSPWPWTWQGAWHLDALSPYCNTACVRGQGVIKPCPQKTKIGV